MTYSLPFFIKHFSYPERHQNYSEKEIIFCLELLPDYKKSIIINIKPINMNVEKYLGLKSTLIELGYGDEIAWQRDLKPVDNAETFRDQIIWVILNSGMREQVCRIIAKRIRDAREAGKDISTAFNHHGKVDAIKYVWSDHQRLFDEYVLSTDKIAYLQTIPFLGTITKYHAAKSLGVDCIKPDRHLVRISEQAGFSDCNSMCKLLSEKSGDKISVVDIILWRSANLGMV